MRPLGLVVNQARLLRMRRGVGCRNARRTAGRPSTRRAARHRTPKPAARRPRTRHAAWFLTAKPTAKRTRTRLATGLTTVARGGEQGAAAQASGVTSIWLRGWTKKARRPSLPRPRDVERWERPCCPYCGELPGRVDRAHKVHVHRGHREIIHAWVGRYGRPNG